MNTYRNIIILVIAITTFWSCEKSENCITGNGKLTSREYIISDFDRVFIHGTADVYINKETSTSMLVEGEENVLSVLDVELNNGELNIGRNNCFRNALRLKVYLSTSTLQEIGISGSCNVYSPDTFKTHSFRTGIDGEGFIDVNIDAQEFHASVSGTGDIRAKGNADTQSYRISGSGDISCFELEGSNAEVKIEGIGDVEVNVDSKLDIEISGIGNVYYMGNPKVTQKISGTGKIVNVQ